MSTEIEQLREAYQIEKQWRKDSDDRATNFEEGLGIISDILNYATDNNVTRDKIMAWTKDSINALLRGEKITRPPRLSNLKS